MVPVDGTDYSWRALEYACDLASLSRGSLVVMNVTSEQHSSPLFALEGDFPEEQFGDEVLCSAHAMMNGKNIDCTYLLVSEHNIAASILKTVEDERCDAIVLGSRGLGALEGLFRSSVSQVVVENATVPVTVVK